MLTTGRPPGIQSAGAPPYRYTPGRTISSAKRRSRSAAAFRHVQQGRPALEVRDGAEEPLQLLVGRAIAAIGRVELGVAALQPGRVEQGRERCDLVPAHARAAHAGVDTQMK